MPTTRSRTLKSRTELERDRELEALGLGIAPGLPGDDRSEIVDRAEIGAGQPRRGAPAGGPQAEVIDRAVDRSQAPASLPGVRRQDPGLVLARAVHARYLRAPRGDLRRERRPRPHLPGHRWRDGRRP